MDDKEKRPLIAVTTPIAGIPGAVPAVIVGITDAAFDSMKGGTTLDLDLRKLGIPASLVIVRGTSHADITETLGMAAASVGAPFSDGRGKPLPDLGIDKPTRQ